MRKYYWRNHGAMSFGNVILWYRSITNGVTTKYLFAGKRIISVRPDGRVGKFRSFDAALGFVVEEPNGQANAKP